VIFGNKSILKGTTVLKWALGKGRVHLTGYAGQMCEFQPMAETHSITKRLVIQVGVLAIVAERKFEAAKTKPDHSI